VCVCVCVLGGSCPAQKPKPKPRFRLDSPELGRQLGRRTTISGLLVLVVLPLPLGLICTPARQTPKSTSGEIALPCTAFVGAMLCGALSGLTY
jgi:hypothetical protein